MVNRPDQDMQGVHSPARKLALSAPPDAGLDRQRYSSPRPGRSIHPSVSAVAHSLFTRTLHRVRREPALVLLSGAIALVIISAFILVTLGVSMLNSGPTGPAWTAAMTEHPPTVAPTGTIDLQPNFPTPNTVKGSSSSSLPQAAPTPIIPPTPTGTSTTGGPQGTLTVQITSTLTVVTNNTRVPVQVQTSEPGVNIRLEVTYSVAPYSYTSGSSTTDGNGNGTLNWSVRLRGVSANGTPAQAIVFVVATDNTGQQATSQPMTVEITG